MTSQTPAVPVGVAWRTLSRWHFYAGLFAMPFILILSLTGALYLFKADYCIGRNAAGAICPSPPRKTPTPSLPQRSPATPAAR